jgi:hypothetical protein
VAEVLEVVGRIGYVADTGYCCMAEVVEAYGCVVEVGWHWIDAAFGPASALASIKEKETKSK